MNESEKNKSPVNYTRVQTTEANPDKSGWYDTDRGKVWWDGKWFLPIEYWYKLVEDGPIEIRTAEQILYEQHEGFDEWKSWVIIDAMERYANQFKTKQQ